MTPALLRPGRPEDAAGIAAVYAPYVTGTAVSFETDPPDAAVVAERMQAAPRLPWYVAARWDAGGEEVVGYAYATQHRARPAYRWSVEVSVYLAAGERGQGTGRALYELLLPELGDLGYVRALAGITLPNPASVGLHEALGFTPVGVFVGVGWKLGAWRDVGWWQLALADADADAAAGSDPVEPRTL